MPSEKSITRKNRLTRFASLGAILFALITLLHTGIAHAGSLSLTPSSGTYHVGDHVSVRVLVNASESINAVSGKLQFSPSTLSATSISKSGSIMTLWAQEPTFSNSGGTATFDGVDVNGFSGSNGTIVTVSFLAKSEGTATLSLTGSSVLANDGNGTDVTKNVGSATFTILPAVQKEPEIPTVPLPTVPMPSETPSTQTIVYVTPPTVTDYSAAISKDNYIVVKGTATPNTSITITLLNNKTKENSNTAITSDDNGTFTYVSDHKPLPGRYTITLSELIEGVNGPLSGPIHIHVFSSVFTLWLSTILAIQIDLYWVLLAFIILLILFLILRKRSRKTLESTSSIKKESKPRKKIIFPN